ncbi:hypothetical protein TIFTF001_030776 [Ficus carica]|uniref:Uncharacterized protein n=1 Tax=Ficus carica TaxID=3494 RepID=A0AA88J066_FICCA|nr:hypothetical protein TIFTF001_030776 [Ficus carica]
MPPPSSPKDCHHHTNLTPHATTVVAERLPPPYKSHHCGDQTPQRISIA